METEEDRRDWHDLMHPMTKGQNWYRQDILSSNKWQALTKENKRRHPVCMRCGDAPATESHHLTYVRVKQFLIGDIISVCHQCHKNIHMEEQILAEKRRK